MGHTVRAAGPSAGPWIGLAAGCWAANGALGASVAAGLVHTGRFRWIHHALYVTTTTATVLAAVLCGCSASTSRRAAARALAPALLPLAALPHVGTPAQGHLRRHALAALCPAPFYATALHRAHGPRAH